MSVPQTMPNLMSTHKAVVMQNFLDWTLAPDVTNQPQLYRDERSRMCANPLLVSTSSTNTIVRRRYSGTKTAQTRTYYTRSTTSSPPTMFLFSGESEPLRISRRCFGIVLQCIRGDKLDHSAVKGIMRDF